MRGNATDGEEEVEVMVWATGGRAKGTEERRCRRAGQEGHEVTS